MGHYKFNKIRSKKIYQSGIDLILEVCQAKCYCGTKQNYSSTQQKCIGLLVQKATVNDHYQTPQKCIDNS